MRKIYKIYDNEYHYTLYIYFSNDILKDRLDIYKKYPEFGSLDRKIDKDTLGLFSWTNNNNQIYFICLHEDIKKNNAGIKIIVHEAAHAAYRILKHREALKNKNEEAYVDLIGWISQGMYDKIIKVKGVKK
jgi:hypothetical protein